MENKEDRRKKFEEAKKARERAEKERKSGYSNPVDMPDFHYLTLEQDKCQVFRMLGESLEMRNKPTDPLMIERSIIRADDNSYFTCIWHQDKDWPLRVLARKLAKYKTEGKGKEAVKTYENKGCELLKRYLTNGKPDANVFETGMAPKKFVLANVIDRMDNWCVENKHSKVFAWSSTEKDGKTFYESGMTYGFYKYIFDNKCTSIGSHFEDVDFVVRRFSQKTRPSDDTYYLVMYNEEKRAIQTWSDKDKIDYMSYVNPEDILSDEELVYERYSLEGIPFISQPTPMGIIMAKMGKFIKDIDAKYNWGLWDMCVEWKAKEIAEANATKAKKESDVAETLADSKEEDLPNEVEHKAKVAKVAKTPKKAVFTEDDMNVFEGLAKLTDDEKSKIVSVDSEEMTMEFNIDADVDCPTCNKSFPEMFNTCPYCGEDF